jgi:SAM-dependent methyltransferase
VTSESQQRDHYDAIFSDYEKHYDDPSSHRYRNEFVYDPLFEGVDLNDARVLEAMCGSGQATRYVTERGARVVGLDISNQAIASYRNRWKDATAVCGSILESGFPSESFDCVVVIGGLHHLHPNVDAAVREIARVLRPGGHFCFVEPHAGSLPDLFRKVWYKHDRYFADNEASVDVSELASAHAIPFESVREMFFGGIAWLLVVNSLVFRIPHQLKPYYTPPLLAVERWTKPLQTRRMSCMAACHWIKR